MKTKNATTTTPTPAAEPVGKLSPDELAEELIRLSDGASNNHEDRRALEAALVKVGEAEAALAAARAKVDRAGEKRLRILRAVSVEEAEAILRESPADVNLKILCQKRTGWKVLQEKGASDADLGQFLAKRGAGWPEFRPHPHRIPSSMTNYSGGSAAVWVDPDKGPDGAAHLSGQKLVEAVRRVMNIPKPAPAPKPAPKKTAPKGKSKTTAAAAAPKAQDKGGDADDDAGGADCQTEMEKVARNAPDHKLEEHLLALTQRKDPNPDGRDQMRREVIRKELARRSGQKVKAPVAASKSAPPKKASAGVDFRPQTWGQLAATLRGIARPIHLAADLPTQGTRTEMERFFWDAFKREMRPAEARDAWEKTGRDNLPEAFMSEPAKPEVKRVGGKTRAQMNAILRANGRKELERKRALHAPLTPSDAPSFTIIDAILDRMYGPQDVETIVAGSPVRAIADSPAPAPALAKPRVPMPHAGDEGETIPIQPHGQKLTWYQWRRSFIDVYHRMMEKAGRLEHQGVGLRRAQSSRDDDFEPTGELLDMYNKGFKPAAAGKSYVDLLVAREQKPAAPVPPAKGDKPKEVAAARQAHDAVIGSGGTFEQALDAGTKAMLAHGPDSKCRICGCTEEDCRECIEATGHPCHWVDDPIRKGDLCSRCKPAEYGLRVSGMLAGGGAHAMDVPVTGQGERAGHDCYQVLAFGGSEMWVRKAGSEFPAAEPGPGDDPNADGRGVYVSGVREIIVRGSAKGDKAHIVIRVARGADGLHRTGHLLEFKGAVAWNANSDEPVRASGQAVELEHYAVKTRAEIMIRLIADAPGTCGKGSLWSAEQKAVYNAAIKALELFIQHNPACKPAAAAASGAKSKVG